jgi:hypothetical protein
VATTQEIATKNANAGAESAPKTIDPAAPAGAANSLGAESVRDGRPATDDQVVEAMDEEGPGITDAA